MPDISLDLRYLRYAIIAAQHRSFRRAAEALGIAQSTLTRRVQILEHRIGLQIFDRDRSGIKLTRAGRLFLEEASKGMHQLRRAVHVAASTRDGVRGELQIGVLVSLTSGFLHRTLREFHKRHPGIRVSLQEGSAEESLLRVATGELDISFVPGEPRLSGRNAVLLWTEGIYAVLPAEHPLAAREEVSWAELRKETFLVGQHGTGLEVHAYIIRKFAAFGPGPRIEVHDLSREDLMNMVAMGYGVTLASASRIASANPGVVFRLIAGKAERLASSAIWSLNNSNPALVHLLSLINEIGAIDKSGADKTVRNVLAFLLSLQAVGGTWLGERAQILDLFL